MTNMTAEYHRRWRKNNPEKVKASARRWRLSNLDAAREASRKWNRSNPERVKSHKSKWLRTPRGRYSSLLCGSKISGREMELTYEEWKEIVKEPCFYCGGDPLSGINGYGIDRVDSSLGYTIQNSVSSCFTCNRMKSSIDQGIFIAQATKIARLHGGSYED